jgi:hypothetical protein
VRAWAHERGELLAGMGEPPVVGVVPGWQAPSIDYYLRPYARARGRPDCPDCGTREALPLESCDSVGTCQARRLTLFDCEHPPIPPSPQCEEIWKSLCGVEWLCL